MPRQPKLRKKKVGRSTYWYTKAGGDKYFGSVTEVKRSDAMKAFVAYLATLQSEDGAGKRRGVTAGELMDVFLKWVAKNRSPATHDMRRRWCNRFAAFCPDGKSRIEDLPAEKIRSDDLEKWMDRPKMAARSARTRLHAETSIRHCWNWATKHPSPTPYLPPTYRPFASVERTRVPNKLLTEADLMTVEEVRAMENAAEIHPDQFRRFGLEATVAKVGVARLKRITGTAGNFADLLRCYHAIGPRTSELLDCRVEDVQLKTGQVVLGRHKRDRTLRESLPRQLTLEPDIKEIFVRHCAGKRPDQHVFLRANGRPWDLRGAAKQFQRAKKVAAALKLGTVREEITIYSYRDLYISDSLMAGNDIHTVAHMAGTSIEMIRRVYGHFRAENLHAAQARVAEYRRGQRGG